MYTYTTLVYAENWAQSSRYKREKKVLECHKNIQFYHYHKNNGKYILTRPIEELHVKIKKNHIYEFFNRCRKCGIYYSKDIKYCLDCNRLLRQYSKLREIKRID
jgi:hypothetical protein